MVRVTIHSRTGNRVLAVAGAFYAIAGLALFAWFLVDTWGAATMIDRALQMLLVGAIALGLWFIQIARMNLTTVQISADSHAPQRRANVEATL